MLYMLYTIRGDPDTQEKRTMTPDDFRQWRVEHNYTAAELATELGVTANTIHRWERGEVAMPRMVELACHGLLFRHGPRCRCTGNRCGCNPDRWRTSGRYGSQRAYDPH